MVTRVGRSRPCDECPWRLDVPEGAFPVIQGALDAQEATAGGHVPLGAPLVQCHKAPDEQPLGCAGWLAVEGGNHLGVRLAVIQGRLDPAALAPDPDGPPLVGSMADMIDRHAPAA